MTEPLLSELSVAGRRGHQVPEFRGRVDTLPAELLRDDLRLPELSELDVVRHFTHLSSLNYSIDTGFYPLGSCTMKYNPKVNDQAVLMPGFARVHPYQPEETAQGAIELLYHLQTDLAAILRMDAVSLQPAAGAHGELLGLMLIRAYHEHRGEGHRTAVLVPSAAHGTNPASAAR